MEAAIAGLVQRFVGAKGTLISLRQAPPAGTVDHFALSIEGFNEDAVKRTLEQRGTLHAGTTTPDST